jgi:hypothetical protein
LKFDFILLNKTFKMKIEFFAFTSAILLLNLVSTQGPPPLQPKYTPADPNYLELKTTTAPYDQYEKKCPEGCTSCDSQVTATTNCLTCNYGYFLY